MRTGNIYLINGKRVIVAEGRLYIELEPDTESQPGDQERAEMLKNGLKTHYTGKPKRTYKKRTAKNQPNGTRGGKQDPDRRAKMEQAIKGGMDCPEFIEEFGVSNATFYTIRKSLGLGKKRKPEFIGVQPEDEEEAEPIGISRKVECLRGCLEFNTNKALVGPNRAKCPDCHGEVKLVDLDG